MVKKVGTRIRIESEDASKASAPEHGATDSHVVVEQFTREFSAVLQLTREKQAKELTSESFGGSPEDVSNARQEVAFFGDIAQKLTPLVDRLMQATHDQINTTKKTELLLVFGDKFYHVQEFRAASVFFYEKVLVLDEMKAKTPEQVAVSRPQGVLERILASTSSPTVKRSRLEGQSYVRSLFGVAMCCFHVQKRSDGFVKHPGRLEKMIEALTFLRLGMETAVAMERQYSGQFAWLTLNGSVFIYSIAKPLQALGFSREVVTYLKWSLLAMESAVALSTTKYIMWRLQLGSAICDCYEDLALKETMRSDQHLKSAVACAAYVQQVVQRLRKEEELDMPLPVDVQHVLTQAETTSAMLATRVKAAAGHQPLTRSTIEAAFPVVRDQMRAAIDAMESLSREIKQQHGGQSSFVLTPATPHPPTNEAMSELFAFVMEIVTPMLKPLVEGEELASQSALDNTIFPVSFHLSVIRHCFQLGKSDDQMILLVKSGHTRLKSTSLERDATIIFCLLELFEVLHEIQQSWLSWESLSEDERLELEANPRQQLPVSGGAIPASKFLVRLSKAMQDCVFHGDGTISRTNQELMMSVALQMWREFAVPILEELDATEPSQMSRPFVRLTCELLLTIHFTFTAVKFEDLLLHGRVCLRLATLLSIRGKARRGSQVVRQCLERINSRRSELVHFASHFHSVVDRESDPGATTPISKLSFSCSIGDPSGSNSLSEGANPRDRVGVRGTGSQFGGMHQDLCCVQVDLTLLSYRLELQAASMVDVLPQTNSKPSVGTPGVPLQANSVISAAEMKLVEECDQNGYARVLLNIQRLVHPQKSLKERCTIADESIQLLQQVEQQEVKLCRQLASASERKPEAAESVVPLAPIVISRSSSAITVQIVEYHPSLPSLKNRSVEYYMVFAKATGVGTAVSLNSNHLTGTAAPVYPPHLDVTISGLLPNESYVFAVAAFDTKHEVINSIGETSEPVVALNPLPLPMCYGYLAKACYDTQLAGRANKAAHYLYNAVVSHVCAGRPSWMENPFYRQALKRDIVAQFPVPTLNLCIQALLILCHDEPGDLERDGKLITTSDLDAQSLTMTQTKALEDSRKISMAIEIACATDNLEAIRVLCFKGYRLLLPLLHLKGSCDGLTFAALVTFYQALHVIPSEKWDGDTRNICARVGFELFRIAQEAHGDISRVTIPLIVQNHTQPEQVHSGGVVHNEEHESLREVVALFKLAISSQGSPEVSTPAPAAASAATPRGAKGAAAATTKDKSQSNTPQATPRSASETEKEAGGMQSLTELLQAAGNDLVMVFATLEQHSSSDRRTIEFASKVCGAVLGSGANGISQMDKFLSSLKVAGEISNQFRATLESLGGGELLPEPKDVAAPDEANPLSSRTDQENKINETPETERTAPALAGVDDDYLYRWYGELFFIQSVLLFRKITKLCDTVEEVDTTNGPNTEDCTYDFLHPDNNKEDDNALEADTPQETISTEDHELSVAQTDPNDVAEGNQIDRLFGELMEKTAGCCKLFRLASCWQGLQAAAQQLWNAVWLAWIAPSRIGTSPARLGYLSTCVDALLDMMDTAMKGSLDPNAASTTAIPLTAPISASAEQSMALSTVVYAATSALNIDQTWLAQLMAYALKAFCSFKDWKNIVQKGSRYHTLCGSSTEGTRFSEQNLPILIYAQQQIVNHQETLLKAAEEELTAYVTAFQEQEAKKKKKKSRLVVEEVLSPEEITFRANKQAMEQHIQELITDRDRELEKLANLSVIYDDLSSAINKSHQALNTCHELVEKYRRLDKRTTDGINAHRHQEELLALRRQVIASYNRCVILSRQKRQKRIVCQALQEAGDFHLACGDVKSATKSWLESLDNAFSTLNVGVSWRVVLTPPANQFLESGGSNTNKDTIAGDELWVGMQCCSVLSKLVMLSSGNKLHKTIDYALMAAAIFTRFYSCSLPHPTKCFLFGSYRILGQFWPGRKLLTDPDRVFPFTFCIMLVLVPEVLLQYEHQYATTAMPIIAGYEYVAEFCLEDANHVANARRFRVEALVQCGRFQEAFAVAMKLLRGGSTPRSSTGVPELGTTIFHDSKPILDESNRAALNWLISLNAEQTQADLKKCYHEALVGHILVMILHLVVALARHESRYDRDAAIARSAAKKLAQALLLTIKPSDVPIPPAQTDEEADGDTSTEHAPSSVSWEQLQIHRIRADIHLQLSYLAFYEGEWSTSRSSAMDAISEYNAIPTGPERQLRLELDHKLKYSLVLARGTFVAKCRAQTVACSLAQTYYRAAFETAETAIEETATTGEEHFRQHLESLKLQAEVFLGEREKTERELFVLREEALASHTSASLTYVHTLQALSSLLRSKALLSSQPAALNAVNERLSEAECVLDALLEHDGWIGVCADQQQAAKRLNIYQPGIPEFVQVHADLAQVLLECPLNPGNENIQTRQERALQSVESAIRAIDHTMQRMSTTKARLLLLKGVILSKKLYGTMTRTQTDSATVLPVHGEKKLEQRFEECVEAFTGSIKSSIEGGYDRQLVRLTLIELVDLFGQKLISGSEDAHVQAAFHYLNLALEVQKHEAVLFDTLELQNGTITSIEKLPPSVSASINAQSEAKEDVSASPPTNSKALDVAAIVNYFVRLLRMQHILPVCTAALQDTCALLHSFLVQHHSTYSRMACLTDLPPVPSSDPEIRAGMICALWGQGLAPALASEVGEIAHNDKITFYFTLGTTTVSIAEDSPAASNIDAIARMEKFASSPLLGKRGNVDRQEVQHLKAALSKLRTQMEDEDSLLIDRNVFPKSLHLLLREIQRLFRGAERNGSQDKVNDTLAAEDASSQSLQDAFGNSTSVDCTLDMVRRLEDLFSINEGANVVDNELCYFLRDLLD